NHPPEKVLKGFQTITRAVEEARQAMKPGIKGMEIDSIARKIVTEAGYQEFPHALGHQVGRFAHDGTALLGPAWEKYADKPYRLLEPGMVFTIEPRLTVENRGVITIEEMVLVTETGAEFLSHPQRELLLIT
ncbi:MAG: M24 family metallopeptidase, partial [Candidatus Saccharicenans sp.]|nr:M24 family metallopeptidase [Candidatus Saccharicenans sp.]